MKKTSRGVSHDRTDDHLSTYANSLRFESAFWDLCLRFGRLNQQTDPPSVDQHVSIHVPWPQAKLAIYYLLVNVLHHENANGPIRIPPQLVPNLGEVVASIPADLLNLPQTRERIDALASLHAHLFGERSEPDNTSVDTTSRPS